MSRFLPLLTAVLVLAGCGTETTGPSAAGSPSPADGGVLFTETTVLEGGGHGPQLCLGGVMESYPPQCGGPDVLGWDWDEVGGFERASRTTWGQYVVIGTYDQDRDTFTLTEPAVPDEQYDGPRPGSEAGEQPGTPCDEPEGCDSRAQHTETELRRIQDELAGTAGLLGVAAGHDRVELTVVHDDGTLQDQLDETYGPGVVVVTSALQPYPR